MVDNLRPLRSWKLALELGPRGLDLIERFCKDGHLVRRTPLARASEPLDCRRLQERRGVRLENPRQR